MDVGDVVVRLVALSTALIVAGMVARRLQSRHLGIVGAAANLLLSCGVASGGAAAWLALTPGRMARAPTARPMPAPKSTPARADPGDYVAEVGTLRRGDPLREVWGSFAVVLLTPHTRAATPLCESLRPYGVAAAARFDDAVALDGRVVGVKPIYWPLLAGARNDGCAALVGAYDYGRAQLMRERLGLRGPGPFIAVAKLRGRAPTMATIATWNFAAIPDDEIDRAVEDFVALYRRNPLHGQAGASATYRQVVKTSLIDFSRPVAALFGIAPARAVP